MIYESILLHLSYLQPIFGKRGIQVIIRIHCFATKYCIILFFSEEIFFFLWLQAFILDNVCCYMCHSCFSFITELKHSAMRHKIACLISIEGGHSIDSSLPALRMYYHLGVRSMALTHTCNTPW